MTKAAVYLRQSFDQTGEGVAVGRQREDCITLCQLKRWEVYAFYSDNDVSAYTGAKRPQFEKMKKDAAAGKFDAIVVFHIDRLLRRVVDLTPLIDLQIPISSVTGDMDLSTPTGRMVAQLIVVVAEHEVAHKGFRQKRANRARALMGRPHVGLAPFGYRYVLDPTDKAGKRKVLKVNTREKRVIEAAYREVIATKGKLNLTETARKWNDANFRTSRGHEWLPRTVRLCLLSPRNAGQRAYGGEVVAQAQWEPLVNYETWQQAKAYLTEPSRLLNKSGNARKYMMSGLAVCGYPGCGKVMGTGRTEKGLRTYVCHDRRHLSRSAEPVDAFIREVVVQRLSRPDALRLLVESPSVTTERMQRQIGSLRQRLNQLPALFAGTGVSSESVAASAATISASIEELEAKIEFNGRADVLRDLVDAPDPGAVWDGLDVHHRRAVVDCLMKVTLRQAGRGSRTFRPESVGIDWK